MIRPRRLSHGDTVGIAAPAMGMCEPMEPFLRLGLNALNSMGFQVKCAPHALDRADQVPLPAEQRASDLNALFADPDVRAIFCLCGGSGVAAVLPLLDWDLIAANPKIVIGFSANTALLTGLHVRTGLITFHGPHLLDGLGEFPEPLPFTTEMLLRVISRPEPVGRLIPPELWTTGFPSESIPRRLYPNAGWRWLRGGRASGRLLGGNLTALRSLAGTPYWPACDSTVLFIEEVFMGRSVLRDLDEGLTHLRQLGVFDAIRGLVIGKVNDMPPAEQPLFEALLRQHTAPYTFPVLCDVDLGHTSPMITLPIGVRASLDAAGNLFEITEPAVR